MRTLFLVCLYKNAALISKSFRQTEYQANQQLLAWMKHSDSYSGDFKPVEVAA